MTGIDLNRVLEPEINRDHLHNQNRDRRSALPSTGVFNRFANLGIIRNKRHLAISNLHLMHLNLPPYLVLLNILNLKSSMEIKQILSNTL